MSVAHYENFPVASFLVPASLRGAVIAIYRFARFADDLADEGDAAPAERLAALARCDDALRGIAAGTPTDDPLYNALASAVARHRLPLAPLHDLVSAFRQDVTTTRYATGDALFDYCTRSANPIGRLLLHLYGVANGESLRCSDAVCSALQLANFWQDVAVDWRKGRVYLPQEDLDRFGVSEAQIGEGRCDTAWRAMMRFETARARALLEAGRPLSRMLPWRQGLELAGVIAGGHLILERIDRAGGDVFRHRPVLSRTDWARVAWGALAPLSRSAAGT